MHVWHENIRNLYINQIIWWNLSLVPKETMHIPAHQVSHNLELEQQYAISFIYTRIKYSIIYDDRTIYYFYVVSHYELRNLMDITAERHCKKYARTLKLKNSWRANMIFYNKLLDFRHKGHHKAEDTLWLCHPYIISWVWSRYESMVIVLDKL